MVSAPLRPGLRFSVTGAMKRYPRRCSGFDVTGFLCIVIKRPADFTDAHLECCIPDEDVRPDRIEQFLFRDEPSCVLHEVAQDVVCLGRQWNVAAVAFQTGAPDVERARSEDERRITGSGKLLSCTHDGTIIMRRPIDGGTKAQPRQCRARAVMRLSPESADITSVARRHHPRVSHRPSPNRRCGSA